ncbi:MAG: ribosome biogenesis GTPase Der [Chitinophagales bacterium]|nr:ribosome biogenesis GTPase Der [Chitinophagales bacterium]MDW8419548.1 ribosome biogenesis GTPase Der [Chitinophagales bacterium]
MSFTVAIVGRPNVGKSTLFNRLIGEKKSITDDVSGVTRDRIYGECEWGRHKFSVIDTGGFVPHSTDVFEKHIREQVMIAVEEASLLLFVVDATTGITALDDEFGNLLRKSQKKVFLVVNKVDNLERKNDAAEFYSMGFDNIFFIASISGSGTGELLDAIIERIPDTPDTTPDVDNLSNVPKVCIVGQPNVGKSSLVNALMGEERSIVTEIAGTTRDSIHSYYNKFGKRLILIDTAGIRRKNRVKENLEFYSVIRAVKAIDESDVAVVVIDATKGITHQDLTIYRMAVRKHRGIIVAVNKWDLIEKETNTARDMEAVIKAKLAPFNDVPVIFISAHEKQRIFRIVETVEMVYNNLRRRIPTSELNEVMLKVIEGYGPPATDGKLVTIKYVTQLPSAHPTFAFFSNHPKYIREPYRNFLENKLREHFEFTGVPISIVFREK